MIKEYSGMSVEGNKSKWIEQYQEIKAYKNDSCSTSSKKHVADAVEWLVEWHTFSTQNCILFHRVFRNKNSHVCKMATLQKLFIFS